MKKLNYDKLSSLQHLWCNDHDRWLYIAKTEDGDIYYNFCQGDDYKYFLKYYVNPDYGLSEFLNMNVQDHNNIEEVNEMIWVYANAIRCYESYKN